MESFGRSAREIPVSGEGKFCTNRVWAVEIDDGLRFSESCGLHKDFQGEWFLSLKLIS
jgi:hypothetical protein